MFDQQIALKLSGSGQYGHGHFAVCAGQVGTTQSQAINSIFFDVGDPDRVRLTDV